MKLTAGGLLRIDRLFSWPRLMADWLIRQRQPQPTPGAGKAVVIKLMGLGSITKLTALCEENNVNIKELAFITFARHADLARLFGFTEVILIRRESLSLFIKDCLSAIAACRQMHPKLIVDFERCSHAVGLFSTILAWKANCAKISFENRRNDLHSPQLTSYAVKGISYEQMFLSGISHLPTSASERCIRLVAIDKNKVVVNINCSDYLLARRYPKAEYRKLIELIHDRNADLKFHLTGTSDEFEYVQDLVTELKARGISAINQAGAWSLNTFTEQLADCALLITGDSGPLHLAAYLKIPLLAIWGPTQAHYFGYDKSQLISNASLNLSCSPCLLDPTSRPAIACSGRIDCMKISPVLLADQASHLLENLTTSRQVVLPFHTTINTLRLPS